MTSHPTGQAAGPAANAHVVRFTYAIDTAIEAGRFFQARILRWYYAILIVGIVGGAAVVFTPGFERVGLWSLLFCGLVLTVLHFNLLDRFLGRRRLRSLIGKTFEVTIGEDGIAWAGPMWTGTAPWTAVTEVRTNERTVLLIGDRILLCYVPSIAFANATEQAEIVAYARRQIEAATTGQAGTDRPTGHGADAQ